MPSPYLSVLGVAQDGGHPQPGCRRPCCAPGVARHLPACLALVDPESGERWLIDATPALPEQLARLDQIAPPRGPAPDLAGLLLTHAHIGHYTGLLYLGREVMGARGVPVHVMPRMATFLSEHGPWSQLVSLGNVVLHVVPDGAEVQLNERLSARAILVPHRDEYAETVAWRIQGPNRSALYLPDIDAWERWDVALEAALADVDVAFLDGTFWSDGELGRDMAEVPHPRIVATLARVASLSTKERNKVQFLHFNHTNPTLDPTSPQAAQVRAAGCHLAAEGERHSL